MGPDLHDLGQIGEAEAHFHGFLGLGGLPRCLHHQDVLIFFGHLHGFSDAGLHAHEEVKGFGEGEALLLAIIGDNKVGLQGMDSSKCWHL